MVADCGLCVPPLMLAVTISAGVVGGYSAPFGPGAEIVPERVIEVVPAEIVVADCVRPLNAVGA